MAGPYVEVGLEPWFVPLVQRLCDCLLECVKEGMPAQVAEDVLKAALDTAVGAAVKVKG